MLKRLFVIGAVLVMAGCTSPKFEGEAIAETNQTKSMTIIEDDATRDVFLASMLAWCNDNGYTCKVALDGSQPKQAQRADPARSMDCAHGISSAVRRVRRVQARSGGAPIGWGSARRNPRSSRATAPSGRAVP